MYPKSPFIARPTGSRGFALIISISLMAFILMLILSLSSMIQVEIKTSTINSQIQVARQNALLGLNTAIGELQRTLGPDQRITATAAIFEGTDNDLSLGNTISYPHLLGVWKTDTWTPGTNINYTTQKRNNFVQWLISSPAGDRTSLEALGFAANSYDGDTVNLVDEGTLGATGAATPSNVIEAPLVPIDTDETGHYAWVVLDEGVKASVNLPSVVDSEAWGSTNAQEVALYGSPAPSGVPSITDMGKFSASYDDNKQTRIMSFASGALAFDLAGGNADDYSAHFHDLTTLSAGVLTDPVNGGLKKDLTLLSEYDSLSDSDFEPRYLYSSGSTATYDSEPTWSQVVNYLSSYRSNRLTLGTNNIPYLTSSTSDWSLDSNEMLPPRSSHSPSPAITRVQLFFSVLATSLKHQAALDLDSDTQGVYGSHSRMLYLVATPVVTLYNPYNVPIKTESLYLSMTGIPVGFRFYREDQTTGNFLSLTESSVPFDAMITSPNNQPRIKTKGMEFVMSLSASDDSDDDFILGPGETVVMTPFTDNTNTSMVNMSNYKAIMQSTLKGKPGYVEATGLLYDYLNPLRSNPRANYEYTNEANDLNLIVSSDEVTGTNVTIPSKRNIGSNSYQYIVVNNDEEMKVNIDLVKPHWPEDEDDKPFKIELYSAHPFDAGSATVNRIGQYTFEYSDIDALRTAAERFTSNTFPLSRDLIAGTNLTLYSGIIDTHTAADVIPTPLAVLDVFSQTTIDNNNPSMPWSFSNATTLAGTNNLSAMSSFNQPYQITLRDFSATVNIDPKNHGVAFTGINSDDGAKFATHFEQPLIPVQSIAGLQHANLASSSYLPRVDYVVGNSFANPLVSLGSVADNSAALDYRLLDHSYLANNTLWDSYYLSTLGTYRSVFDSTGPTLADNIDQYLAGQSLMNSNLKLNLQTSSTTEIRDTLLGDADALQPDAYRKVAAYQYLDGVFNVNSTSVAAWKAILSAAAAQAVDAPPSITESNDTISFSTNSAGGYTFSRFRVSNNTASFDADATETSSSLTESSPAKRAAWQGYRDLTDAQLEDLAENIVDEVKSRGPFLSLSEFVNHRLGTSAADERNMMGAIDAAIAETDINNTVSDDMGEDADIASLGLANSGYSTVSSAKGIPAFLTQADILQQIGQRLNVRSDTFRIRAYGDSVNPINGEKHRAYCEAIVQRTPDYLDSSLEPWDDAPASDLMGRRFKVISLNWLREDEI